MRIGIDLDGVVADFNAGWMLRYNAEFGTSLTPDAVVTWDGPQELTHFTDMDAFWHWAEGGDRHSIFRHLELYHGAVDALNTLIERHDVVILTSKPDWAIHDTFAWIADNRIPTREVHITEQKWQVPCDVYLDDAPHQIRLIHRNRPEATMCRFVRPWNHQVAGVVDVADWPAFLSVVDRVSLGHEA